MWLSIILYILYVHPLSGQPWGALWGPGLAACVLSQVQLFVTPWTAAHQAPLSMEFSRQEYWSELPFPMPEELPNPGTEPVSLAHLLHWQAGQDSLLTVPPRKPCGTGRQGGGGRSVYGGGIEAK